MSRPIKFRAWDRDNKKMYNFLPLTIHRNDITPTYWEPLLDSARKVFDVMQFSGLLDKNGKEIYEGDIVRILYTDWISKSDDDPRTLDEYLRDIAEVKVIIWKVQGFYASHAIDGYAESMEPGTHGYIEVIGNIYENPELLNQRTLKEAN